MYQAGWSKQEIAIPARGYAMHGFGQPGHRALGIRNPLQARCFYIAESDQAPLIYCCLDLGYITHAMRAGVVARLDALWGAAWDEARLVLTCTHTHSGPGGCAHDGLYNLVTPGFVPDHVEQIVSACVAAIVDARDRAAPTRLALSSAPLADDEPVAWNRSLKAYNRNPDVSPRAHTETHLALDRTMHVIGFWRDDKLQALWSLFGVHATCLGSHNHNHDGDNKGYAALQTEQELESRGCDRPVAIFAQATAGDVSPHYHGPGDKRRRRKLKGEAEYQYARENGRRQSQHALAMMESGLPLPVTGPLDGVLTYVDMSDQLASPEYADHQQGARTSAPCHGVSFFAGTPIDGPGMPAPLVMAARRLARRVKRQRLQKAAPDYQRLYASQGAKDILMEAGRKRVLGYPLDRIPLPGFADPLVAELKRQVGLGALDSSAMVPSVLPLQIVRIGNLRLVCAPGEFTTVAGRRLLQAVQAQLPPRQQERSLICTYCNDYMGYVTTREEYQQQAYEGGHTVFGQWTLAAFQTCFAQLARVLGQQPQARQHDILTRPPAVPPAELARRSDLPPRQG
ncbi:MAG: neutral/alkaline non-lysosomal ceramidase N-terminal domain-containing protein [Alcanivorax sp.]|nr:neutral/alkaline non-lysosomal ceramidase N-terminal domain-containing protein [Alcanivorax sp.]